MNGLLIYLDVKIVGNGLPPGLVVEAACPGLLPGIAVEVAEPDRDPLQRSCIQIPIVNDLLIYLDVEIVSDGLPPSPVAEAAGPGLLPSPAIEVAGPCPDPHQRGCV